jgi:murein DD-endopeptidase MepM/ murein hydrolase activator NlpD
MKKARCEVPPGGLPLLSPLAKDPKTAGQGSAPPAPPVAKADDKKTGETKTGETKAGDGTPAPAPSPAPAPEAPKAADSKPAEPKPVETKAADATPPPPPASPTLESGFKYYPPGVLAPQDSARGRKDRHVYLPNIIYPLKLGAGQYPHMNSQIWGFGGGGWNGKGAAGGGECDPRNYDALQQRDDYCEVRGWAMPMCPAGKGHQGQDIRPPTCKDKTWEAQAVADGIITAVTSNTTVRLKATDGTTFEYLHMHPDTIKVKEGQKVKQGDVLGRVSNIMNGKRDTTMHLHFQVRQQRTINGKLVDAYVPTFPSLIAALRKAKGLDPGIDANGDLIVDPRFEIGAVAQAPTPPPAPKPAPEPPKPAPEPPKPAPELPKPAPEPPKPEPKAEAPQPAPAPAPPARASEPSKPATGAAQGWWDWTKEKASTAKGYASSAKDKVVDWWAGWRSKN